MENIHADLVVLYIMANRMILDTTKNLPKNPLRMFYEKK